MTNPSPQIHIASFVLLARADALPSVLQHVRVLSDVEIAAQDPSGKLVLLIEAEHERRVADIADAIRDLSGVLSLSMIEHHMDDASSMAEEIQA